MTETSDVWATPIKIQTAIAGAAARTLADTTTVNETKLEVKDVDFYYGKFQALRAINLNVPALRITAIIGPSGTGKSTFLRLLNRMSDLVPGSHAEGNISFDGENLLAAQTSLMQLRRRIGMVFQRPNPFPKSIFDNVAYGPRMHGQKNKAQLKELVERSLHQAALWDEVKDKLNISAMALSGGQQQRLCIARAIAVEPEILLMDEPCSALDPISTIKIEELMLELRKRLTIVIVTHNMQQAARASDYTSVFMMAPDRAGELVEFGNTKDIFTNPKNERTEQYITGRFG